MCVLFVKGTVVCTKRSRTASVERHAAPTMTTTTAATTTATAAPPPGEGEREEEEEH